MKILSLNSQLKVPLYRQLYNEIRTAILSGRLQPGVQLPASRDLAAELKVSRNTVLNAYEQLLAEGYIHGKEGSGTFVSQLLTQSSQKLKRHKHRVSERGKILGNIEVSVPSNSSAKISFRPGTPALEKFPFALWSKLLVRSLGELTAKDFHYSRSAGYVPLRKAIADYLRRNRGVNCDVEQVLIVSGSQQALDLCARILLDPGDSVWMEDPGYRGARAAFRAAGAEIISVGLDAEGLSWKSVPAYRSPRLIYVTPSHQFPLGITMSLSRRLELLEMANRQNVWILEDDYDSEFRYDGRPLAALQGLDQNERVVYMGTFSKVMFPGLRLGYLVVPDDLSRTFAKAKALLDRHSPILEQAALAEFIVSGKFERHIREMRKLYARRQKAMIAAVEQIFPNWTIQASPAGMHLVTRLPRGWNDQKISALAAEHGIDVPALSMYSNGRQLSPGGLLLGYAAIPEARVRKAVEALAKAIIFSTTESRSSRS
jgi:GntR family transcriptional regulator / MocR family aminotransferase